MGINLILQIELGLHPYNKLKDFISSRCGISCVWWTFKS